MPRAARRPCRRPAASRVAALSHRLEDLLRESQKREAAPPGMAKCPVCGVAIEPTKTRKVRVHDDPLSGGRCAASGTPWSEFGKRAPKPVPAAPRRAARKGARKGARRTKGRRARP